MLLKPIVVLLAAVSLASAVEVRVATFNIGAHFGETFFDYSLGDPGTPDYESVKSILDRLDADVVALEEVHSADVDDDDNPTDLATLAAALGYLYVYVAPTSDAGSLQGPFDPSLRNAFLSRYPFLSTTSIRSPLGAHELTRLHPVVRVDVPGTTHDPVLISAHLKAGSPTEDRFRRAVEMKRLVGHLTTLGLTNDDNYIILGDFNLNPNYASVTFNSLPSGLPGAFDLGDDLAFPISYSTNPLAYFTTPGASRLDPRQLNGSASTYGTTSPGGPTLDLMLVSPAIAGRSFAAEVYNSTLDVSNSSGLPKDGSPLNSNTSATASDHYAVFADFELDSDLPNLDLVLSTSSVSEGQPDGTVTATVTLPAIKPNAVTVTLSSDDPAAAGPMSPTIVIPAGSLSGSIGLRTPRNFIQDPPRSVGLTATASGHDPDSVVLQVNDVDGPYAFTASGQTVVENFGGFNGAHDPAPWITTGSLTWSGMDDGSSTAAGLRAYGSIPDPSLGFLPSGVGTVTSATFVNQSAVPLTGLQIAFDVEQWRAALNGAADSLSAEIFYNGQSTPLPALSHAASQSLPSGAVAGGLTTAKSTSVYGLSIPPGASFELRVTFTPGSVGGVQPDDVFVNEIHYDNTSTDTGEFVEIAVGPGYGGTLPNVSLVIYNGSNGQTGSTHTLDTFTPGSTTASGHRLFSKLISGLQNDSEGFALVVGGSVLHFISYEGAFAATNGPASGMTAVNIGVTQSGSDPVGQAALGLVGTGGSASEFAWMKFTGVAHSPGQPNQGQSFTVPVPPPQGLAIDNVSVTFVADTDFDDDGIADSIDPDDDNDGQSDADEMAFGTNPFNAASIFKSVLSQSNGLKLTFPGAAGIAYAVDFSTDLDDWDELSTHAGSGQPIIVTLPEVEPAMFFRVRVGP